jgi:hypothetical protein
MNCVAGIQQQRISGVGLTSRHGARSSLLGAQLPAGLISRPGTAHKARQGTLRVAAAASSPPVPQLTGDDLKEAELKRLRTVRAVRCSLAGCRAPS